jgi:hypothetical protein
LTRTAGPSLPTRGITVPDGMQLGGDRRAPAADRRRYGIHNDAWDSHSDRLSYRQVTLSYANRRRSPHRSATRPGRPAQPGVPPSPTPDLARRSRPRHLAEADRHGQPLRHAGSPQPRRQVGAGGSTPAAEPYPWAPGVLMAARWSSSYQLTKARPVEIRC